MAHIVMLIPVAVSAGTKTVSFGLLEALTNKGVRTAILPNFDVETVEHTLVAKSREDIFADVFEECQTAARDKDVVILSGLPLTKPYFLELNFSLATALDAAVIFVFAPGQDLQSNLRQLKIIIEPYQNRYQRHIIGVLANKINPQEVTILTNYIDSLGVKIPLLGIIPQKNELTEKVSDFYSGKVISKYFDLNWVWPFLNNVATAAFTPTMFRHKLFSLAQQANKKIVLPEGDEPRTLQAANICMEQGIARCVLLGKKQAIYDTCAKHNIKLNEQIEIIEPSSISAKYIEPLCVVRRSKGMTPEEAIKQLGDNTVLGTMMLYLGEVDGLISGAVHTTANTIRPALQIIKTASDTKLVSSIFFMCLPDQVLVYGDCALNQNPSAEELADIAIQSARSAVAFGITPRVAMLSYSTGDSGSGPDVDKIKAATAIAKQLRPDLAIDGPMQYDAAIDKEIAALKMPNSKVAGSATVLIVPNLNVGNITYKAVQRSTGIVCVGPILQGLRKPVNDLSRGCSVTDIVFTIAITALQA